LVFRPGQWVLIWDWLHDNVEAEHDFKQWLHFAPELLLRQHEQQYSASAPRLSTPLRIASLLPNVEAQRPVLGREEPKQGWWSPKGRVVLPSYALPLQQRGRTAIFATLLAFCNELSPDATSRVAPSGRNAHLRWRADGRAHVLTFARPDDGALELNYRTD
jgi:hypothetical protein